MNTIYLDHAATTPVHPRAAAKMAEVMENTFGNPSSVHSFGRASRRLLDEARAVLADSVNARFNEVVITGGGTEADNLAILGTARANRHKGNHIITSTIEHHAVLHTCKALEQEGFDISWLEPDETGRIRPSDIEAALRDDTILVTIMYGNNEVGTLQPIKEIGSLLAGHQAYFHTDAVQAYGVETLDVGELGVDLLSVTAHKVNGPKGIGFLYVRTGTKLSSVLFGGDQELKRRAGTENLVSLSGFAEAVLLMRETMSSRKTLYEQMKARFLDILQVEKVPFMVNGSEHHSLPHVLNVSFPGTDVESLLMNLDMAGVAVSSGSACTAGSMEPSHVLVSMFGPESDRSRNAIRISFGFGNTIEQVEEAALKTANIVRRLLNGKEE